MPQRLNLYGESNTERGSHPEGPKYGKNLSKDVFVGLLQFYMKSLLINFGRKQEYRIILV